MTYLEYFNKWTKIIDYNTLTSILSKLNYLYNKVLICPDKSNVFKAFNLCPLDNLKIVMIGQDPYPQKNVATGILFGNHKENTNNLLSPSLEVIKESVIDFEIPHNNITFDNSLEEWAKQGVLLINSALTCEMNKVGSHTMLWRPFISTMLANLSNYKTGIIYVLFGEQAKTLRPYINEKYNDIIESKHPAYYARTKTKLPHSLFLNIDKILKERYGNSIVWYHESK